MLGSRWFNCFDVNRLKKIGGKLQLSVGVTCNANLLEIEGTLTQGLRPGRTFRESVGGIFETDSYDRSNGLRYHTFDTTPDTEFNQ